MVQTKILSLSLELLLTDPIGSAAVVLEQWTWFIAEFAPLQQMAKIVELDVAPDVHTSERFSDGGFPSKSSPKTRLSLTV
jgi:hypothetical protein